MNEWILALLLGGSPEPILIATGYETAEQCETAGDLMKAADAAVRKSSKNYSISCTEQPRQDQK